MLTTPDITEAIDAGQIVECPDCGCLGLPMDYAIACARGQYVLVCPECGAEFQNITLADASF